MSIQLKAIKMIREMLATGQHQPPAEFPKTLKRGFEYSHFDSILTYYHSDLHGRRRVLLKISGGL